MNNTQQATYNYFDDSQDPENLDPEWLFKLPSFELTTRSTFEPLIDPVQLNALMENGEDPEEVLHTSFLDYWRSKCYYNLLRQELIDIVIIIMPLVLILAVFLVPLVHIVALLLAVLIFGSLPIILYKISQYTRNPEHVVAKHLERALGFQIRRIAGYPHHQVTLYESLMAFLGKAAIHYLFILITTLFYTFTFAVFQQNTPLVYFILLIILYFQWNVFIPRISKIKTQQRINQLLAQHLYLIQIYIKKEIKGKPRWYLGHRQELLTLLLDYGISPKAIQKLLPGVELQPEIILAEPKVDLL
jgi:hypothetical protein